MLASTMAGMATKKDKLLHFFQLSSEKGDFSREEASIVADVTAVRGVWRGHAPRLTSVQPTAEDERRA